MTDRDQFEAAWRKEYPLHGTTTFMRSMLNPEAYVNTRVQDGWLMYRAALLSASKPAAKAQMQAAEIIKQWIRDHESELSFTEFARIDASLERLMMHLALVAPFAAPAQSAKPVAIPQVKPRLLNQLRRFNECCEDSEADGHDVDREDMHSLAELGAVRPAPGGRHYMTDFGHYLLAAPQPSPTAVVLDDERCLICAETEPHTGTCGSKDPRALCNRAASPQPVEQTARTHTTQPGESVMGIALRQCGNEAEWRHILACNPKFADLLPHEYFPVGTVLTLPPIAAPTVCDHNYVNGECTKCRCISGSE